MLFESANQLLEQNYVYYMLAGDNLLFLLLIKNNNEIFLSKFNKNIVKLNLAANYGGWRGDIAIIFGFPFLVLPTMFPNIILKVEEIF